MVFTENEALTQHQINDKSNVCHRCKAFKTQKMQDSEECDALLIEDFRVKIQEERIQHTKTEKTDIIEVTSNQYCHQQS